MPKKSAKKPAKKAPARAKAAAPPQAMAGPPQGGGNPQQAMMARQLLQRILPMLMQRAQAGRQGGGGMPGPAGMPPGGMPGGPPRMPPGGMPGGPQMLPRAPVGPMATPMRPGMGMPPQGPPRMR